MYKICIQYTYLFKRFERKPFFVHMDRTLKLKKDITPIKIGGFYPNELDLYFMITYLCIKYESNNQIFSKDIKRKPFFVHANGITDRMYGRTAVILYAPLLKMAGLQQEFAKWLCHNYW